MSFAPIQLLESYEAPFVWTSLDDGEDKFISQAWYLGPVGTLPTAKIFSLSCILIHKEESQVYKNTNPSGIAPLWVPLSTYDQWQEDGVNVTPRPIANFRHGLDLTDDPVNDRTIVDVDEGELDLALMGGLLNLTTQTTGNLPSNYTSVISTVSSATSGLVQVPSIAWNHVTTGSDRVLIVEVITEEVATVTGVTYNGVALTLDSTETNVTGNIRTELWYLVNPPLGTYQIVVSVTPDACITAGAKGFTNCDTTVIFDGTAQTDTGAGTSTSVSFSTTYPNTLLNTFVGTSVLPTTHTPSTGQSSDWTITAAATVQGSSSSKLVGLQTTTTTGYTLAPSQEFSMITYGIVGKPSGTGSTGASNLLINQTPDNGTYDLLIGDVDGVNTVFNVQAGLYLTGTLAVYLNGQLLEQGATQDWFETDPVTGEFEFVTAPLSGDVITAVFQTTSGGFGAQSGIQWQDEGINLGLSGTVNEVDFVGAGVTATRLGDKVTVTVPGASGGDTTSQHIATMDIAQYSPVGVPFSMPGYISPAIVDEVEFTVSPALGSAFSSARAFCVDKANSIYLFVAVDLANSDVDLVLGQFDIATQSWTFGTPTNQNYTGSSATNVTVVNIAAGKFGIYCRNFFAPSSMIIGTFTGTAFGTITTNSLLSLPGSDEGIGDVVVMSDDVFVQVLEYEPGGADRVYFAWYTVSGTTSTLVSSSFVTDTAQIGFVKCERLSANKVVATYTVNTLSNIRMVIAEFDTGTSTWTIGTPTNSSFSAGSVSLNNYDLAVPDTNDWYVIARGASVSYYSVSGLVPTLFSSGSSSAAALSTASETALVKGFDSGDDMYLVNINASNNVYFSRLYTDNLTQPVVVQTSASFPETNTFNLLANAFSFNDIFTTTRGLTGTGIDFFMTTFGANPVVNMTSQLYATTSFIGVAQNAGTTTDTINVVTAGQTEINQDFVSGALVSVNDGAFVESYTPAYNAYVTSEGNKIIL